MKEGKQIDNKADQEWVRKTHDINKADTESVKVGSIVTHEGKRYRVTSKIPTNADFGKLVVKMTEGFIMGPANWTPDNWRVCEPI